MPSANIWIGIGNLTRDPELRQTKNGKSVGTIIVAVNRSFTSDGRDREETCYVDCELWGKLAETANAYLAKGSPVYVEGRLRTDRWEKNGETHSKLRCVAHRVQFLGRPRHQSDDEDAAATPYEHRLPPDEEPDFPVDPQDNLPGVSDGQGDCPF